MPRELWNLAIQLSALSNYCDREDNAAGSKTASAHHPSSRSPPVATGLDLADHSVPDGILEGHAAQGKGTDKTAKWPEGNISVRSHVIPELSKHLLAGGSRYGTITPAAVKLCLLPPGVAADEPREIMSLSYLLYSAPIEHDRVMADPVLREYARKLLPSKWLKVIKPEWDDYNEFIEGKRWCIVVPNG